MNGSIRIIGGKWRGRKLPVLDSEGLRPTTDRIKEMLFNWLMPVIGDSSCLDCFSGSGSLGFEAASRGASHVTLLEKNRIIATQLKKNAQLLPHPNCNIVNADTLNWLNSIANTSFDIVFIDPPFHQKLAEKAIHYLEKNNWLKPNAYIYVETERNYALTDLLPTNWQLHREKVIGQVYSRLFIRESI